MTDARQDKIRQDRTGRDMTRQDTTRQDKTIQDNRVCVCLARFGGAALARDPDATASLLLHSLGLYVFEVASLAFVDLAAETKRYDHAPLDGYLMRMCLRSVGDFRLRWAFEIEPCGTTLRLHLYSSCVRFYGPCSCIRIRLTVAQVARRVNARCIKRALALHLALLVCSVAFPFDSALVRGVWPPVVG